MQTMVSTHVWQRRTHRVIAMAVIIIGLTMMISTIPQCIYIGLVFIMMSLGWLAWMRMKDKKAEPPSPNNQPHGAVSPVLFLVASQNFTQRPCIPTPVDPNDKPPSYDQIVKLDGLPPDYFSVLAAKPPRYEDIENVEKVLPVAIPIEDIPTVHSLCPCEDSRNSNLNAATSSSVCSFELNQCRFSSVDLSIPINSDGIAESPNLSENEDTKDDSDYSSSDKDSSLDNTSTSSSESEMN
ncbi:hypothetical protein Avbf_12179 [Armadillidium vulgare]|nr:hypothetical protein Avbf_12179 [Armadillidium vulgare]